MTSFRVYVIAPQRDRDGSHFQLVAKPPAGSGAKKKYKTSGTADRIEAEARAREWERILNGVHAPLPARATVGEVLAKHLAHREVDGTPESTVTTYRTAFKRVEPLVGDVEAELLDGPRLAKARDALAARLDGKTVNVTLSRVRAAWRWAIELGHVRAPWPAIRNAKAKRTKKRPMRPREVAAFLRWAETFRAGAKSRPCWEGFFGMLADAGPRSGDACSRDGKHLDRESRRVWIYDAKLKTDRWSGLTERTVALLPEVGPDEPLFSGQRGRITPQQALEVFRKGVKAIGIVDHSRLDVHSLRRTNAKEADRTGVSQGLAAKQQGHVSMPTQFRYQFDPDDDEDMAAVADQIASRWTPHLNPPTDPPPIRRKSMAGHAPSGSCWTAGDAAGRLVAGRTSIREARGTPQHAAVTGRAASCRVAPIAGGGTALLADPLAAVYGRLADLGPDVRQALWGLQSPWRVVALARALADAFPDEFTLPSAAQEVRRAK